MIEPKNETIDGMKFYFQPLPALMALKLDKKVITLIIPALGGVDKIDLDAKIDLKTITQSIGGALRSLGDEEFEKFVLDLLSTSLYLEDGNPQQEITKEKFDLIFMGKLPTVYKLIFAVMKFNKFSPFELLGGGNVMKKILSFTEKTKKEKVNGKGSGK